MVLKNDRTQRILDLIDKFKLCEAHHIARLFYTYNHGIIKAREKLTALVEEGTLKRKRNDLNSKYVYYFKEPAQIKHKLTVLEYYVICCEKYGHVQCEVEYTGINGIRPDAYIRFNKDKRARFLEVHLSNNELNIDKYLYPARKMGEFPEIHVVTDRKVSVSTETNQKLKVTVISVEKMGEKI